MQVGLRFRQLDRHGIPIHYHPRPVWIGGDIALDLLFGHRGSPSPIRAGLPALALAGQILNRISDDMLFLRHGLLSGMNKSLIASRHIYTTVLATDLRGRNKTAGRRSAAKFRQDFVISSLPGRCGRTTRGVGTAGSRASALRILRFPSIPGSLALIPDYGRRNSRFPMNHSYNNQLILCTFMPEPSPRPAEIPGFFPVLREFAGPLSVVL